MVCPNAYTLVDESYRGDRRGIEDAIQEGMFDEKVLVLMLIHEAFMGEQK